MYVCMYMYIYATPYCNTIIHDSPSCVVKKHLTEVTFVRACFNYHFHLQYDLQWCGHSFLESDGTLITLLMKLLYCTHATCGDIVSYSAKIIHMYSLHRTLTRLISFYYLPERVNAVKSYKKILPAATPVGHSATGKCGCSDANNVRHHLHLWFLFLTAFPSLGGTECFPFNWLTSCGCLFKFSEPVQKWCITNINMAVSYYLWGM